MRKALIVGINHYDHSSPLFGCVNDAYGVKSVLERHADGTVNFSAKLLVANGPHEPITRLTLKQNVRELFADDSDIALFYFAGHGHIENTGGYLCTTESEAADGGLPLSEVLTIANQSPAKNKVIVLDSCHSGIAGSSPLAQQISELSEGLTILTASTAAQYANENNGSGVFTTLFIDALNGAAANLVGDITPGSVYAHIDQSLGAWKQRPIFKTNVKSFVSLRKVQPPIELSSLQRLLEFFPAAGFEFPLTPEYETTSDMAEPTKMEIFSILQKLVKVNLVIPVGEEHMYWAAINSKACKLTVLGEHYRKLVETKMI